MIERVERGRGGHFICGSQCRFRRNTLLSEGSKHIVVSTVGGYYSPLNKSAEPDAIGYERHYETMAFIGEYQGEYIDANVSKQVSFNTDWGIEYNEGNKDHIDNLANDMHEAVVDEIKHNFIEYYNKANEEVR